MTAIGLDKLQHAVENDAAIRRVRRLQPAGGAGDKIYPPTYPGERRNDPPRHVFEHRRMNAENVLCVLIDSVQSQANRLEEALRVVRDAGSVAFPVVAVDFKGTGVADIGRITTLDAPHRVFDAIVRDSELDGRPFRETPDGQRLVEATAQKARAVYDLSPTALVFGAWNSTGEGGGLGAKFARCVVSEIIGVGVATERRLDRDTGEIRDEPSGQRTGSRVDPLGIRSAVHVFKWPNGDWSIDRPPEKEKQAKEKWKEARPSEINHSNIAPSITPLGVSIDHALHTFVLSFAALRRLRFTNDGMGAAADAVARTALAALALTAVAAQDRGGYFLRSRCDLVPEPGSSAAFEIVHSDGRTEAIELDFEGACRLLAEASSSAKSADLAWRQADLVLKPQGKLVDLVKRSRELALAGELEPDEEET